MAVETCAIPAFGILTTCWNADIWTRESITFEIGTSSARGRACIAAERVRWTYHVTMRLQERRLTGDVLREAAATLEIIEEYPHDK